MKTFFINGVVGWDVTPKELNTFLKEAKGEDVIIVFNSPGGSVYDGFEIFNALIDYSGAITFVMNSLTASIASYIAMVPGSKRIVRENSVFMIHNAWMLAIGDYNELRKSADIIESMTNIISQSYVKITNRDIEEIKEMMDNESWFFGKEIVDNGFADELVPNDKAIDGIEFDKEYRDENPYYFDSLSKKDCFDQAKSKFELMKNKMKNEGKEYNFEKLVALIKEKDFSENETEKNKNPIMEVENMDLDTFLDKNPDSKAEYTKRVEKDSLEKVRSALEEDRKNILEILSIAGMKISDNVQDCIMNGKNVEYFAFQELKRINEERKNSDTQDFGSFKTKNQIPGDTKSKKIRHEDSERQKQIDAWDKAYDTYGQKGGK